MLLPLPAKPSGNKQDPWSGKKHPSFMIAQQDRKSHFGIYFLLVCKLISP